MWEKDMRFETWNVRSL